LPEHTGFVGDKGNGSTSFLQGVPAEPGSFSVVLTVTDSAGVSTQVTVVLTVAPKLQIRTVRAGTARAGKRYRLALRSAGGVGPAQWTVAAGALPSGLKLDAKTGVVSGSSRRAGRFRFTVAVTDSLDAKAAMTYTLRVGR
jgi:large repetitive protein